MFFITMFKTFILNKSFEHKNPEFFFSDCSVWGVMEESTFRKVRKERAADKSANMTNKNSVSIEWLWGSAFHIRT